MVAVFCVACTTGVDVELEVFLGESGCIVLAGEGGSDFGAAAASAVDSVVASVVSSGGSIFCYNCSKR